ncbi:MAG: LecA/PA-IL family lectin [Acidobacteriota bacterium]
MKTFVHGVNRVLAVYVVVVGGAALLMALRLSSAAPPPAPRPAKGIDMEWSQVQDVTVPAKPTGIWTWAVDYVKGPARILIEATAGGSWSYSPGRACGPDGDLTALTSAGATLLPSAPTGALLAKIGGSTAGAADGTVRVAGSKVYFEIDSTVNGPILLTVNDEPGGMSDNSGELKVKISIAAIPQAPGAAPAVDAPAKK